MEVNEKRRVFYNIALTLIKKKGFKAMTMRDLATEMQCDVANIYNYTKSKDALLEDLLFEISEKFHAGILAIETSGFSAIEKLKAIIALHIRLTTEYPNQVLLLVNEWRNLKEDSLKKFIDFRVSYEKSLATTLEQGVQSQELYIENIEFTTNCVLSSLRWLYGWDHSNYNHIELERMMRAFVFGGILLKDVPMNSN
jgi:TetR/AcrR family transcriptional regulator, cholesterol catabolism regulator